MKRIKYKGREKEEKRKWYQIILWAKNNIIEEGQKIILGGEKEIEKNKE